MKIVVLGATGSTGRLLVDEALNAGHEVVAYVRRPEAVPPRARLTVVGGALEDVAAMSATFSGADAVVSCLGLWPTFRSVVFGGVDFQQRMLPLILAALEQARTAHFVLMSSFGIGATAKKASWSARMLYRSPFARPLFEDKDRAERCLLDTPVSWTAVYPVSLRHGETSATVTVKPLDEVGGVPGLPVISYADVARVLLELAGDRTRVGQRLLVTTANGWSAEASAT